MSKEDFKNFVKSNTNLVKYVNNNTMTWQKFYDMYELYGSDNEIWNDYKNIEVKETKNNEKAIKDVIGMVKSVDLHKVQRGIESIQKTISMVQDFSIKSPSTSNYESVPVYKRFED